MSKQSPILGKKVKALTDGGWELQGIVAHDKDDRIVLTTDSGEVLLVFKKKVSAILIIKDEVEAPKPDSNSGRNTEVNESSANQNFVVFKGKKQQEKQRAEDKLVDDDLSEGGVSLPHEVLMSVPSSDRFRGGDDDFSISMTSLFGSSRISVTSNDESK
jgi:hypothetical protein